MWNLFITFRYTVSVKMDSDRLSGNFKHGSRPVSVAQWCLSLPFVPFQVLEELAPSPEQFTSHTWMLTWQLQTDWPSDGHRRFLETLHLWDGGEADPWIFQRTIRTMRFETWDFFTKWLTPMGYRKIVCRVDSNYGGTGRCLCFHVKCDSSAEMCHLRSFHRCINVKLLFTII